MQGREDIKLTSYLANAAGPVPLVLDLRIAHNRWGNSSDPSINRHLHYPNDMDRSLNETTLSLNFGNLGASKLACCEPPAPVSLVCVVGKTLRSVHEYVHKYGNGKLSYLLKKTNHFPCVQVNTGPLH
jgi:hypothetical protein